VIDPAPNPPLHQAKGGKANAVAQMPGAYAYVSRLFVMWRTIYDLYDSISHTAAFGGGGPCDVCVAQDDLVFHRGYPQVVLVRR
jgi:hypothetical protein